MKPIKLAIVGGSSTGKTTLFKELENIYKVHPEIEFINESARQYFNEHPTDNPFVFAVQEKILNLALLKESLALKKNPKVIITDTSVLEVAFYTKILGDNRGSEKFLKSLENYIPTYTKFLVMNHLDVPFKNDSVRKEDKKIRDSIHTMLLDFYIERDLPYEIINGNVEERKTKAVKIIDSYLS